MRSAQRKEYLTLEKLRLHESYIDQKLADNT